MLKICLIFWKSEPDYAYKRCAYKNMYSWFFTISCHSITDRIGTPQAGISINEIKAIFY